MTGPEPNRQAIMLALERLLSWPEIARSPQLARFLDYIVRRKLDGEEQSVKAYSIAVDVFGRSTDFDPQADPIVRVQARRLRRLLDEYYQGPGLGESAQIRLPVGRYIPDFVVQAEGALAPGPAPLLTPRVEPVRGRTGRLPSSWFALAVLTFGTALGAYALGEWGRARENVAQPSNALQRPTVGIVEFQNLSTDAQLRPQVSGLAIELVTDLEQFRTIGTRYAGTGEASTIPADQPISDFMLSGIVRLDGGVVQYSAILTEMGTGGVVWNHTLAIDPDAAMAPGVLDDVAKSFALVLGSPRGPLHAPARLMLASNGAEQGAVSLYLCRVLFDLYRETGGAAEAGRADVCFSALPETDKQTAEALAATASLVVEQGGPSMAVETSLADRYRIAEASLQRALSLDPVNGFVWEQQARLHQAEGAFDLARDDFASAVQLNPANADVLAGFARLLALGGSLSEAEPMALDATEGSPSPPPWYFGVPALLALRDGDLPRAIESAERYAEADRELGPILAIMAAQRSGDSAVVNRYLPQILDVPAFRAKGVLPRLRERISDGALLAAIRNTLVAAGVPPQALVRSF